MSLSCQYDQVNSLNYLGDLVRQVAVEAKLKLPDNYPKLVTLKGGEFKIGSPTLSVNEEVLTINGRLDPYLVYLTETVAAGNGPEEAAETVSSIMSEPTEYGFSWLGENGVSFEEQIEIPGLNPDTLVEVDLRPNTILYEPVNSNELTFRGIVDLIIHTAVPQRLEVVSDINTQPCGLVKVTREQVVLEELDCFTKVVTPIRNTLLLPNFKPGINRILNYNIAAVGVNSEPYNEKIAVKGSLEIALQYVGADETGRPNEIFVNEWNRQHETAIPFEIFIDYNATGRIVTEPKITIANMTLREVAPRELHCQLDLECEMKIMNIIAKELVVEVAPEAGEIIDVEKHLINLAEFVDETQGLINFDTTVGLGAEAPEIERLLTYQGFLHDVQLEAGDNQLLLNGNLDVRLYYIANGLGEQHLWQTGWEKCNSKAIPISGQLSCPGLQPGVIFRSRVSLEGLKLEIQGARTVRAQGQLRSCAVVKRPRAFSVIQNCALVTPVEPSARPSMLFYVVQPEDTLWKIARKYETTVNTLTRSNQLANPERLEIGQKLLIPKRIVG
jgi:LysM repeat protein